MTPSKSSTRSPSKKPLSTNRSYSTRRTGRGTSGDISRGSSTSPRIARRLAVGHARPIREPKASSRRQRIRIPGPSWCPFVRAWLAREQCLPPHVEGARSPTGTRHFRRGAARGFSLLAELTARSLSFACAFRRTTTRTPFGERPARLASEAAEPGRRTAMPAPRRLQADRGPAMLVLATSSLVMSWSMKGRRMASLARR